MTELPGLVGRYSVARRLGSGGMGEVFLAYSPAGSPVAVKVIRSDQLDPTTRARFEREALLARTVIGTNRVARFLDADPFADRPWLAMEYVPGPTLLDQVATHGVLPPTLVASLGALIAEGLAAVHAAGLLHRDLKPQNIVLGADGPMIIDFGLGAFIEAPPDSLSQSGYVVGSVRCMPPEQASGRGQVTTAADVYAFGTILLYAAAGHYPYDGDLWEVIAARVVSPDVAPDLSGVPGVLVPLLAGMLAQDMAARPSVEDIGAACAALLTAAGTAAMDARLALIARTAGDQPPPLVDEEEAAVSLDGAVSDGEDEPSPLDVPPVGLSGGGEANSEVPDEDEPETGGEPEGNANAAPGSGPAHQAAPAQGSGGRKRYPWKVAEQLRAQYAMSSQLVSSR
ncbi:serine/threonine-protein kinase [Frankia sp. AgB32]|uniref:serine/threonine-protein kinase n=1 Tax=Frankia sp. AgB32 TaxID=631119 RepID=UPI00200BA69E|nr:serine/threonine-protein kinase [Frankia sp. AgB32]MCK9895054.1 serine/threonine protein kinase [Frankia sp. AgB32]